MVKGSRNWWDSLSALVFTAALWTVVLRLIETEWTKNLTRVETLFFFGLVLGLLLGASRFSKLSVITLSISFSLFFVPWQMAASLDLHTQWTERLLSYGGRLVYSLGLFLANRPVDDPLLFLTAIGLLFWLVTLIGSYQLVRNAKPWGAMALAAAALIAIDIYNPWLATRNRYSGFFVLMILILVARIYYLRQYRRWEDEKVAVDAEVGFDLTRGALVLGVALVLIAWMLPALVKVLTPGTPDRAETIVAWERLRARLGNAVAGLQGAPTPTEFGFSGQLDLGTGISQGTSQIFTISVTEARPEGTRYYWRGYSYDTYEAGQWTSTQEDARWYQPTTWENLIYPEWVGRAVVHLIITPRVPILRTIFLPGVPISISRPAQVIFSSNKRDSVDIVSLKADPLIRGGEYFLVTSSVVNPTTKMLLGAGETYPIWVTDRYLNMPIYIPQRIIDLAKEITKDKVTPYDKAEVITEYLRKNIQYAETIPSPPVGQDPIDWFLFVYKKGFCNYYASAEVIMLRAVGVPARLAVGYAEGTTKDGATFTVVQKDSHAWPEVYFPKVGWVEFEPTVSQDARAFPSGEDIQSSLSAKAGTPIAPFSRGEKRALDGLDKPVRIPSKNPHIPTPIEIILITIGDSILAGMGLWFFWLRTHPLKPVPIIINQIIQRRGWETPTWIKVWAGWVYLSGIERLFWNIAWMLKYLKVEVQPGATPAERVRALIRERPAAKADAEEVLDEYQTITYSQRSGDLSKAKAAVWRLWRIVLLNHPAI